MPRPRFVGASIPGGSDDDDDDVNVFPAPQVSPPRRTEYVRSDDEATLEDVDQAAGGGGNSYDNVLPLPQVSPPRSRIEYVISDDDAEDVDLAVAGGGGGSGDDDDDDTLSSAAAWQRYNQSTPAQRRQLMAAAAESRLRQQQQQSRQLPYAFGMPPSRPIERAHTLRRAEPRRAPAAPTTTTTAAAAAAAVPVYRALETGLLPCSAVAAATDVAVLAFVRRMNHELADAVGGDDARGPPVVQYARALVGPPAATWETLDWRRPESGRSMCFLNAATGIVLADARGDGSCLLHAVLRAHGLETTRPLALRRRMAADMRTLGHAALRVQPRDLGDATAQLCGARALEPTLGVDLVETDTLCAYVQARLGTALLVLVAEPAPAYARYHTSNVCTYEFQLSAARYAVVANRGEQFVAGASGHWQIVGRYDAATRCVATLFAHGDAYVRLLANDFYARAGMPPV